MAKISKYKLRVFSFCWPWYINSSHTIIWVTTFKIIRQKIPLDCCSVVASLTKSHGYSVTTQCIILVLLFFSLSYRWVLTAIFFFKFLRRAVFYYFFPIYEEGEIFPLLSSWTYCSPFCFIFLPFLKPVDIYTHTYCTFAMVHGKRKPRTMNFLSKKGYASKWPICSLSLGSLVNQLLPQKMLWWCYIWEWSGWSKQKLFFICKTDELYW